MSQTHWEQRFFHTLCCCITSVSLVWSWMQIGGKTRIETSSHPSLHPLKYCNLSNYPVPPNYVESIAVNFFPLLPQQSLIHCFLMNFKCEPVNTWWILWEKKISTKALPPVQQQQRIEVKKKTSFHTKVNKLHIECTDWSGFARLYSSGRFCFVTFTVRASLNVSLRDIVSVTDEFSSQ